MISKIKQSKMTTKQDVLNALNSYAIFIPSSFNYMLDGAFDADQNLVDQSKLIKAIYKTLLTNKCIEINQAIISGLENELGINLGKDIESIAKIRQAPSYANFEGNKR